MESFVYLEIYNTILSQKAVTDKNLNTCKLLLIL